MMEDRPLELSELLDRQRWLINLRWTAAASVAVITAGLRWLVGIDLQVMPLFACAAFIGLYNLCFWLYAKSLSRHPQWTQGAVIAANLQISLDLIALTFVLHFTGGVENPFFFYYIFHVIIASILLSRSAAFLQATLAIVLFSGLAILEYAGLIPHVTVPQLEADRHYSQVVYVVAVLAAFSSTLYFSAYLATAIVGGLRLREAQVIELKEALESEEKALEQAYDRLQEVERFKSGYMRKVSHELRAPLSSIQSLITVVLEGLTGTIPEKTREILGRASVRTKELLDLVSDLLTLSRTRDVKMEQVRQEVSLAEIASRIMPLFQAQAIEKGIDMTIAIDPGLPSILADPEGMEELLTNLVSNAIKYTPSGGMVRVTLQTSDDNIVLAVADTGVGIEPQELPHIFEEFHRAKRAREMVPEGTGLGLAIVKAILDAHNGRMAVDSKVGEGTTFVVTLPVAEGGEKGGNEKEGEQAKGWERGEKGEGDGPRTLTHLHALIPCFGTILLTRVPFFPITTRGLAHD